MKLAETVTLGGGGLERAALRRSDADWLEDELNSGDALVYPLWRGKLLASGSGGAKALVAVPASHEILQHGTGNFLFLGEVNGRGRFATDISAWEPDDQDAAEVGAFLDQSQQTHPSLGDGAAFHELRSIFTELTPLDGEMAATAKAMLSWHLSHRFCAKCGSESEFHDAGWQRKCASCGAPHFPRTDPVVIMLITHGNDLLLGRSPHWPEGMYSLLAGFVEPGETLEAAVRREVAEETAVKVGQVSYLASQPWPYPSSLMFGCEGEALTREITLDPIELEDAIWISREELAEALDGRHPTLSPARPGAIARFLMEHWLADSLK